MTYTSNYNFNLPAGTDPASITPLNQNFTMIDTYLKASLNLMAADYDSTQTYNEGDIVAHDNALYQCNDDSVTGAWNSAKWDAVTIASLIAEANTVLEEAIGE